MPKLAVVDTGPLYAAIDADDADHDRCVEIMQKSKMLLIFPALVIAEVCYLVGSRLGALVEQQFLQGLKQCEVEAPQGDDWLRIGDLVHQYRDFSLGGVDASVIALAERVNTDTVITLDRRHFSAIRPKHCKTLNLLP